MITEMSGLARAVPLAGGRATWAETIEPPGSVSTKSDGGRLCAQGRLLHHVDPALRPRRVRPVAALLADTAARVVGRKVAPPQLAHERAVPRLVQANSRSVADVGLVVTLDRAGT